MQNIELNKVLNNYGLKRQLSENIHVLKNEMNDVSKHYSEK